MTVAELKPIFIQKYKESQPTDDLDLIQEVGHLFRILYEINFPDLIFGFARNHPSFCDHANKLRFVPEDIRKPLYFGCEKCRYRMELRGGMTKGQMREMFKLKKNYSNDQYFLAVCSNERLIYQVNNLEQPSRHN